MKTTTVLNLKPRYTFVSLTSNSSKHCFHLQFSSNYCYQKLHTKASLRICIYISVKVHHEVDIYCKGIHITELDNYFQNVYIVVGFPVSLLDYKK